MESLNIDRTYSNTAGPTGPLSANPKNYPNMGVGYQMGSLNTDQNDLNMAGQMDTLLIFSTHPHTTSIFIGGLRNVLENSESEMTFSSYQ